MRFCDCKIITATFWKDIGNCNGLSEVSRKFQSISILIFKIKRICWYAEFICIVYCRVSNVQKNMKFSESRLNIEVRKQTIFVHCACCVFPWRVSETPSTLYKNALYLFRRRITVNAADSSAYGSNISVPKCRVVQNVWNIIFLFIWCFVDGAL